MSELIITGGAQLSGSIAVQGSKNAALPLLAASLLTSEEVELKNIPAIADVTSMLALLRSLGAVVEVAGTTVRIRAQTVQGAPSAQTVGRLRGSILLLGALLGRARQVELPYPGGDLIGARPIDVHLDALRQLGARIEKTEAGIRIEGSGLKAGEVTLGEFSVTATENIMLLAATLPGTTTIHTAAAEPHVAALAQMLSGMGATVAGAGTHTITIQGTRKLRGGSYLNIYDMLEAGFLMLLGAVTSAAFTIERVPIADLRLFFKKLREIGLAFRVGAVSADGTASVTLKPSKLKSFRLQVLPHPGIATDLQAPFAVVATQAQGSSLLHDPLYEGRFKHIYELQKMGAEAVICDPHRVIINGPSRLRGNTTPSLDIRAGATLVMAGLIAEGTTTILGADTIDRGYINLDERLRNLGASIERVDSAKAEVVINRKEKAG